MSIGLVTTEAPHDAMMRELRRMFLGDATPIFLLEIAFRTSIIFVYTLLLLRVLGKRGVAQLSLFEVTIIIVLGSTVGDPMLQPDMPLVTAMTAIFVMVLLYRLFMTFLRRSERFERFVEGEPSTLIHEGRLQLDALAREHISQEELFEILRGSGIAQLGQVKRAFLEQSGSLSVFSFAPREVRAGLPIVPPWDIEEPHRCEAERDRMPAGDYACMVCGEIVRLRAREALPRCSRCTGRTWTNAVEAPLGPIEGASADES